MRMSTLLALQAYRTEGKSYDEIMLEFMDEIPPTGFMREFDGRPQSPRLY